ncbi:MAG: RHS repeat-associated core domain-containing protein, partial [Akkermansia sp.]|nr:RHS repeat-associated core domain-containing protein [Akkermansia sp.]
IVECQYDSMGRRAYKKVTTNGSVTLHQRYIYRGYLQIACVDLTRSHHPALWFITWDPTQPVATRPLAIQVNGTWYTYGWDIVKNICELFSTIGFIGESYTYTPYGNVTITGDIKQPILMSSEMSDNETGLTYYNLRYYNSDRGKWLQRDIVNEVYEHNLYRFVNNAPANTRDFIGATPILKVKSTQTWYDDEGGPGYGEHSNDHYIITISAAADFTCKKKTPILEKEYSNLNQEGETAYFWPFQQTYMLSKHVTTLHGSEGLFAFETELAYNSTALSSFTNAIPVGKHPVAAVLLEALKTAISTYIDELSSEQAATFKIFKVHCDCIKKPGRNKVIYQPRVEWLDTLPSDYNERSTLHRLYDKGQEFYVSKWITEP